MSDPTFTAGQRVYHRQRKQFGTFLKPSWTTGESLVDFDDPADPDFADALRVTTAQLVAADEIEENG